MNNGKMTDAEARVHDECDAERRVTVRFMDACFDAMKLAPDTLRRWGVDAQRAKCLEELGELATVLTSDRVELDATVEFERRVIDECADVLIMAVSCASTIGALDWKEQLADRIAFKAARTRERMKAP